MFDWGSGCGHQASWLSAHYGVDVFGIDLANTGVAWANRHARGAFCATNGAQLQWVEPESFDHVYSFAALYHIEPFADACHMMKQLVRLVKKGGTVFNGWSFGNGHDMSASRANWNTCFAEELFHHTPQRSLKSPPAPADAPPAAALSALSVEWVTELGTPATLVTKLLSNADMVPPEE